MIFVVIKPDSPVHSGEIWIQRTLAGKYTVLVRVNGSPTYGGTFDTLDEAINIRDYLDSKNWDKSAVDEIRKQNVLQYSDSRYILKTRTPYRVVKIVDGKQVIFGGYRTFKEARIARDYYEAHNWDTSLRYMI